MGDTSTVGRNNGTSRALRLAERCFEQWRRAKRGRESIPVDLWAAAARAASEIGVNRASRALGLNHTALQDEVRKRARLGAGRQADGGCTEPEAAAQFLSVPLPMARPGSECVLEVEDGQGAKLRIHLKGAATADLASLTRVLWRPPQ